jgi:translation initiation factor 2B subunit (eIF-2B alpha/beta/delta family)
LVVGADSLEEIGFTNKAGIGALVAYALKIGCPVWVLADASKLLPCASDAIRADRNRPDSDIWADPPKRLSILNPYFERTRYQPGIRILTEDGWRTPAQIRREIHAIKVSSLLAY